MMLDKLCLALILFFPDTGMMNFVLNDAFTTAQMILECSMILRRLNDLMSLSTYDTRLMPLEAE
jgi:hypothetical protein